MVDSFQSASSRWPGSSDLPPEESLRELRELLFGKERKSLHLLEENFFNPRLHAREVGRVLPLAISIRASEDDELVKALQLTVEEIIRISVRTKPEILVQALFPIIGTTIRKSIAGAIRDMMQTVSRTLDASFSPRSLKWRWEAFRTGKSFAEVVLLHTMYKVEQIFLIHRSTGLLLDHVVADAAAAQDPDLVSAMFTAIRDFVKDSFASSTSEADNLETLQIGELSIRVEQGPDAILAAVIQGSSPPEYRARLQETLEKIHGDRTEELRNFQGDSSAFAPNRPDLESCLETRFEDGSTGRTGFSPILWALPAILFFLLAGWLFLSWRESHRWAQFLDRLDNEPGIVVAQADKKDGKFRLTGLRDPLAADPATLFKEAGFDGADLDARWEPYIALAPTLVEKRAATLLHPPSTVSLRIEGDTLKVDGAAPPEWIERSMRTALTVPGVAAIDVTSLKNTDETTISELKSQIEATKLLFEIQSADVQAGEESKLDQLADRLKTMMTLAAKTGRTVRLVVSGNVDNTGPPDLNEELKRKRATAVAKLLSARGLATSPVLEIIVQSDPRSEIRERSVTFQAQVMDAPSRSRDQ